MGLLEIASNNKKNTKGASQHTQPQGAQHFTEGHISPRAERSIFDSWPHLDGRGVPEFVASFPIWSHETHL